MIAGLSVTAHGDAHGRIGSPRSGKKVMIWTNAFVERLHRARMVAGSWASMHHRGVSPMAQKMSVFGGNMAQLGWHIAGVACRPIFTSSLENANFRQSRPYRRTFTPLYADSP